MTNKINENEANVYKVMSWIGMAVVLGGAVLAMPIVAVSGLILVAISVTLHFIRVIDIFDKWS